MKKTVVAFIGCLVLVGCTSLSKQERELTIDVVRRAQAQNNATAADVREFLEGNIQNVRELAPDYRDANGLSDEEMQAFINVNEKSKRRVETSLQALDRTTNELHQVEILIGGTPNGS